MKKVLLVSSSGGHFSELNKIELNKKDFIVIYVTEKNKDTVNNSNIDYFIKYGTRKEIFKYMFIFLFNFILAIKIILKEKPNIILSTGAHSCVPFFIVGKLLKKKTVYIESYAKVTTPSLTYKVANKFMDVVIVQHKEMLNIYKDAQYFGGVY